MARFGYNRYALVLAALTFAGIGAGCGGGGSSSKGSAIAASTSGSTAAPTTSAVLPASAAVLASVNFVDADNSQSITKGDKLVCSFSSQLQPIPATNTIDPSTEFSLAVGGDSFGAGAKVAPGTNPNEAQIVLGDNPVLFVSEAFSVAKTTPGSPSGLNVSIFAKGDLKNREGARVVAAATPVDLAGSLSTGFKPAAAMNRARGQHAAVTLDDGRVLVVGGIAAGGGKRAGDFVADNEIYDPLTNTWTVVGQMKNGSVAVKPAMGSAVKLNNGTVLICGGLGVEKKTLLGISLFGLGSEKVDTLETAFIFDPAANTFTKVGNMKHARHSHTATLMADGRVLIAGGYNDSFWSKNNTQAPFEIYDPAKKSFETVSGLLGFLGIGVFKSKEERQSHSATAIEGGSGILLAGGNHWQGGGLFGLIKPKLVMNKGSEVVRGLKTEKAGDLNTPRLNHGAALVNPRNVLIAGGHDVNGPVAALEVYDSATAAWTPAGNLARARSGCDVAVDRNRALVIGGRGAQGEVASVEVFDADAKVMTQVTYNLGAARNGCGVVTLKDGRILVTGGMIGSTKHAESLDGQALDSCEVFVRQ